MAIRIVPQTVQIADAHQFYLATHDVAEMLAFENEDRVGGELQTFAQLLYRILHVARADFRTLPSYAGMNVEQRVFTDD